MHTQTLNGTEAESRGFAVDTTFVLFFLAVDFGQSLVTLGSDGVLSGLTLMLLLVLPYFLFSNYEKPAFGGWVFGRMMIAVFAILLGLLFRQIVGVVLPEAFGYLPMTLLIASAMVSCYIQFYSALRFRLAK